MAKIYPEVPYDFNSSMGEFNIFQALKKLPDDWNIYYSVNWQKREKDGRIRWGEADFVVFSPQNGILVIEVKSGGIGYENGQWIQTRIDTNQKFQMKNPFKQADKSKFKLIEEIDNCLSLGDKCAVEKAVWFPSIKKSDLQKIQLPMDYNINVILTEESLINPLEALTHVYQYYSSTKNTKLSKYSMENIKRIIMPTFNLIPSASNIKTEAEYVFYQMTNEQKKVLDFISEQDTVAIQGAAGTGKTFIAVEQAKRFAKAGKVLFLCFNKYLNLHLRNKCNTDNVDYYNIHSFLLSKFGNEDIFNIDKSLELLETIDLRELGYDYVIIDEAQDFHENLLKCLYEKCFKEQIKIIIFYDKNQLIFQNNLPDIIKDFDCKLTLAKNCRNTIKITSSINSIFEIPMNVNELNVIGTMPMWYYSKDRERIINCISENIDKYIKDGFKFEDIVILTLGAESQSFLQNIEYLGKYRISLNKEDNAIFFTTAKKFKGLEANIVLVVDFCPNLYDDNNYKRNLYVSLSRARQKLEVYTIASDEEIEEISQKLEGEINSISKLGRKFKMIINKID